MNASLSAQELGSMARCLVKVADACGVLDLSDPDWQWVASFGGRQLSGNGSDAWFSEVISLRRQGCTCKPDLTMDGDLFHAEHQEHCALPKTIEWEAELRAEKGRRKADERLGIKPVVPWSVFSTGPKR